MVDFSEAQRLGFIDAFVQFRQETAPDGRTTKQLRQGAHKLLKGCRHHFRSGVVRVSNIGIVVSPARKQAFRSRAMALLDAPSSDDFRRRMQLLLNEYPKCENWAKWWMAPDRAQLLFQSELAMDAQLASRLPDTTNPEESLHNKLYLSVGKGHNLIQGFYALRRFSQMLLREHDASQSEYTVKLDICTLWVA